MSLKKIISTQLMFVLNIFTLPPLRYPEKWKPAFLAMQLGFIAGGIGLIVIDFSNKMVSLL